MFLFSKRNIYYKQTNFELFATRTAMASLGALYHNFPISRKTLSSGIVFFSNFTKQVHTPLGITKSHLNTFRCLLDSYAAKFLWLSFRRRLHDLVAACSSLLTAARKKHAWRSHSHNMCYLIAHIYLVYLVIVKIKLHYEVFNPESWLIHKELQWERDRGKIGFHNIT